MNSSQRLAMGLLATFGLCLSGCSGYTDIDRTYGRRAGNTGMQSVNGTRVLGEMFAEAGHHVGTWRRLSPRLEDSQVIVWAPDDFEPPDEAHRNYLERWLSRKPGRTLVYIGRDFDAASLYWSKVQPAAPPEQMMEIARRSAEARADHDRLQSSTPNEQDCEWFDLRGTKPFRTVKTLSGKWSEGIDAAKTEITLRTRLEIPKAANNSNANPKISSEAISSDEETLTWQSLLTSGDDALVTRVVSSEWPDSQLIVVVNGSFLLNCPLVNHEHRKLAGKLVTACGPNGRVSFLQSTTGGPVIYDEEPALKQATGFESLTTWPLGAIIMHLTALGILACITFFPIFGRPRENSQWGHAAGMRNADFGLHLEAIAEMLERDANVPYAREQLQTYRQKSKSPPQRISLEQQFLK